MPSENRASIRVRNRDLAAGAEGSKYWPSELTKYFWAAIYCLWASTFIGALITVAARGRDVGVSAIAVSLSLPPSRAAILAGYAGTAAVIVIAAGALIASVRYRMLPANGHRIVLYLAPWVALMIANISAGERPGVSWAVYPSLVFTAAFAKFSVDDLRHLGYMSVTTAVLSIAIGIIRPSIGLFYSDESKFIPTPYFLAGPYNHPNQLGLIIALTMFGVGYIQASWFRRIGYATTFGALIWSQSRTAEIAIALCLLVAVLASIGNSARICRAGATLWASLYLGSSVAAVWMVTTATPASFSNRGQIWIATIEYWKMRPIIGYGDQFFTRLGVVASDLSHDAFHAHDQWLQILILSGLLGFASYILLILVVLRSALREASAGGASLPAMIGAFLIISILETIVAFGSVTVLSFATWSIFLVASQAESGIESARASADIRYTRGGTEKGPTCHTTGRIIRENLDTVGGTKTP